MKASIDIGTNTVLLLIADVTEQYIKVVREEQRMPRLGKGVDAGNNLSKAAMKRVIEVLKEYKQIIERDFKDVCSVAVTATSATRDAQNRAEFLNNIESATGWKTKILSGEQEAEYTFKGALSVLSKYTAKEILVLDIGGGSTEIITGDPNNIKDAFSFNMGCVRFTERYLLHAPPFQEELIQCRNAIDCVFESKNFHIGQNVHAVGVAGTLTSLAALTLEIENYQQDLVNGYKIEHHTLTNWIDIFSARSHEELLELNLGILKGREDIFLAGLLILEGFLKHFQLPAIRVSTGGVRHGVLLD